MTNLQKKEPAENSVSGRSHDSDGTPVFRPTMQIKEKYSKKATRIRFFHASISTSASPATYRVHPGRLDMQALRRIRPEKFGFYHYFISFVPQD